MTNFHKSKFFKDVSVAQLLTNRPDSTLLTSTNRLMMGPIIECCNEVNFDVRAIQQLYPPSLIVRIHNGFVEISLPTSFKPIVIHDPSLRAKYRPLETFNRVSARTATNIYDCCKDSCLKNKDEALFFNLHRNSDMSEEDLRELTEKFGRSSN